MLSANTAYFHLFPPTATVAWAAWLWHPFLPPSSSFVVWRALHDSCKRSWSEHIHNVALVAITHAFHSIWMARNGIRFNNAKISFHAAKMKVLTAIAMSATLVAGFTAPTETSILTRLQLKPRLHNAPVISLVLWRVPSIHWMKVNMDGSVTNLPPSAACGGVFRDHLVTFQGCFATPYQFYMRTLWPSSWPYRLAHNNGWQNVWIESDSQAALCTFGNHACSRAFEPTDGRTILLGGTLCHKFSGELS
ncbi:ribonuclease H [Trifolium pratense]|uniref:Ribonuclease H n=1 Tax=Trifolium pratense TaxID=57577 RepID=A0A2K3L5Y2_TRIPR|nr:ribonuclease H [Trifolium pratense]